MRKSKYGWIASRSQHLIVATHSTSDTAEAMLNRRRRHFMRYCLLPLKVYFTSVPSFFVIVSVPVMSVPVDVPVHVAVPASFSLLDVDLKVATRPPRVSSS